MKSVLRKIDQPPVGSRNIVRMNPLLGDDLSNTADAPAEFRAAFSLKLYSARKVRRATFSAWLLKGLWDWNVDQGPLRRSNLLRRSILTSFPKHKV
jgi:hypothetical protein